jgi:hypothetical protein
MTKLPIKEITQRFSSEVQKKFDFLVDDYGFTYQGLKKRDFNYGRDARVSETYLGEGVGVRIPGGSGIAKSVFLYMSCKVEKSPIKHHFMEMMATAAR